MRQISNFKSTLYIILSSRLSEGDVERYRIASSSPTDPFCLISNNPGSYYCCVHQSTYTR